MSWDALPTTLTQYCQDELWRDRCNQHDLRQRWSCWSEGWCTDTKRHMMWCDSDAIRDLTESQWDTLRCLVPYDITSDQGCFRVSLLLLRVRLPETKFQKYGVKERHVIRCDARYDAMSQDVWCWPLSLLHQILQNLSDDSMSWENTWGPDCQSKQICTDTTRDMLSCDSGDIRDIPERQCHALTGMSDKTRCTTIRCEIWWDETDCVMLRLVWTTVRREIRWHLRQVIRWYETGCDTRRQMMWYRQVMWFVVIPCETLTQGTLWYLITPPSKWDKTTLIVNELRCVAYCLEPMSSRRDATRPMQHRWDVTPIRLLVGGEPYRSTATSDVMQQWCDTRPNEATLICVVMPSTLSHNIGTRLYQWYCSFSFAFGSLWRSFRQNERQDDMCYDVMRDMMWSDMLCDADLCPRYIRSCEISDPIPCQDREDEGKGVRCKRTVPIRHELWCDAPVVHPDIYQRPCDSLTDIRYTESVGLDNDMCWYNTMDHDIRCDVIWCVTTKFRYDRSDTDETRQPEMKYSVIKMRHDVWYFVRSGVVIVPSAPVLVPVIRGEPDMVVMSPPPQGFPDPDQRLLLIDKTRTE
jgi:hypothetical protein